MMVHDFWTEGLRFECTRCSSCCRYEPGFVFLSSNDLASLIKHSGLAFRVFIDTFIRIVDVGTGNALSLKETSENDCILWGSQGCSLYEARPEQCSTYPFWQGILETQENWNRESTSCPGIGKGQLVPAETIAENLWKRRFHPALILPYDVALETIDENTLLGRPGIPTDTTDTSQA